MQETYLGVERVDAVCAAVRDCWASLDNPEALAYRERMGARTPAMGVTVQLMVDAARVRRDVHVQPGQRRPEHGRHERQLGARASPWSAAR